MLCRYHDEEWGRALHDDHKLFELLVLEGAQVRCMPAAGSLVHAALVSCTHQSVVRGAAHVQRLHQWQATTQGAVTGQ